MNLTAGSLARRLVAGALGGVLVAGTAGVVYTSARSTPVTPAVDAPTAAASHDPDFEPGERGGTIERFHGDATVPCTPPEGTTLSGNWTHGDYVNAWAKSEGADPSAVAEAARSACGKPAHTVGRRSDEAGAARAEGKGRARGAEQRVKARARGRGPHAPTAGD